MRQPKWTKWAPWHLAVVSTFPPILIMTHFNWLSVNLSSYVRGMASYGDRVNGLYNTRHGFAALSLAMTIFLQRIYMLCACNSRHKVVNKVKLNAPLDVSQKWRMNKRNDCYTYQDIYFVVEVIHHHHWVDSRFQVKVISNPYINTLFCSVSKTSIWSMNSTSFCIKDDKITTFHRFVGNKYQGSKAR